MGASADIAKQVWGNELKTNLAKPQDFTTERCGCVNGSVTYLSIIHVEYLETASLRLRVPTGAGIVELSLLHSTLKCTEVYIYCEVRFG